MIFCLWGRTLGSAKASHHCNRRQTTLILLLVILSCFRNHNMLASGEDQPNTCTSSHDNDNDMRTATATTTTTTTNATQTTIIPRLTHELVHEIIQYKGIYTDNDELEASQLLVEELDTTDLETAARTSYAYWWYATQPKTSDNDGDNDEKVVSELRRLAAQREARRHFVGNNHNIERAKMSLQRAIHLRQKHHVDLLRWMGVPEAQRPPLEEHERERLIRYREYVADEMEKQTTAVVGLDEESRAMILKGSRTNSETNIEGYFVMQTYVAERAMALTEVASRGKQERVFCLFDFAAYTSQNAPPTLELRGALADLQSLYKERLYQLVILDPPFFLNLIFQIISPFLDSRTRAKIVLMSGVDARERVVKASPERQAALQFLLHKKEEYGLCVQTFLHETSFHEYYNLTAPPIEALAS